MREAEGDAMGASPTSTLGAKLDAGLALLNAVLTLGSCAVATLAVVR